MDEQDKKDQALSKVGKRPRRHSGLVPESSGNIILNLIMKPKNPVHPAHLCKI